MIRVDGTATAASLKQLQSDIMRETQQSMRDAAQLAYRSARGTTTFQDRTKALRGSIRWFPGGELRYYVRADAKHAIYVEEDTEPHVIRAKVRRGKPGRLRFFWAKKGVWVSTPEVNHPGTTGKHFMRDARDIGEAALADMLDRRLGALMGQR